MKEKVWYIKIDDREEGPYSIEELRIDRRITPDTLARKKNFPFWRPIRNIAELRSLFVDSEEENEEEKSTRTKVSPQDEIVLDMRRDPPFLYLWLLISVLLILYIIYLLR